MTDIVVFFCATFSVIHVNSLPDSNDAIIFPDSFDTQLRTDDKLEQTIIDAIATGSLHDVQQILKNGGNVNFTNYRNETALHIAATQSAVDIVEFLIQHKAAVNALDINKESPLHWAIAYGRENIAMLDLLIRSGANVNSSNVNADTPLHISAHLGYEKTIEKLIENGAEIEARNSEYKTPLFLAVLTGKLSAVYMLIRNGADINTADTESNTVLHVSSKYGDEKIVDMLIRQGASCFIVNKDEETMLHFSAIFGHEQISEWLIQCGIDVNAKDKHGNTALHIAIRYNQIDFAKYLLHHYADPYVKNKNQMSPYDLARGSDSELFIKLKDILSGLYTLSDIACTKYSNQLTNRITGGELAELNEFPWMAALGFKDERNRTNYDCGGTVISDFFILTAAHCVKSSREPVVVRLGTKSLSDANNQIANYEIQQIIPHPYYSSSTKRNDIALIRLVKRIEFSDSIRPACLDTNLNTDYTNETTTIVTGWGVTSKKFNNRSNELQKTNLRMMPLVECNTTILNYNKEINQRQFRNGISKSQCCAYDPDKTMKDSCQGDSGGPLQIFPSRSILSTIVGIVSFGVSCGTELPSIYTRVSYYGLWIGSYVWPNISSLINK